MITQLTTQNAEETRAAAVHLAQRLKPGSVIALHGDLGAGKTCFIQGLAAALGCDTTATSPTFTLLHEYREGRLPLFHADLYRMEGPQEFLQAGLMDYLDGMGVIAIEWAERIAELLPRDTIHIRLRIGEKPDSRIIEIEEPDA